MGYLKVTAKGQITLKKHVLAHMGVKPGDRVEVKQLPGGLIEVRPDGDKPPIAKLSGILRRPGQRRISIDQMNKFISKAWVGES